MSMEEMVEFRAESHRLPELAGLADILGAVSREVLSIARMTCELQESLSPVLHARAQDDDRLIREMQALDLIAQHLCGVADFLSALSPALPAQWTGDAAAAARAVSLSNLAKRLGSPRDGLNVTDDGKAGAIELFDAGEE